MKPHLFQYLFAYGIVFRLLPFCMVPPINFNH